MQEVLTWLEKAGIRLKRNSCPLWSTWDIKLMTNTVRALVDAPVHKDVSQLQSFLGLVNYYAKFMPNPSSALAPLYQLLKKSRKWNWGKPQAKAFQAVKEALTSSTVLTQYNPNLDLVLDCDVSPYGVGAVL